MAQRLDEAGWPRAIAMVVAVGTNAIVAIGHGASERHDANGTAGRKPLRHWEQRLKVMAVLNACGKAKVMRINASAAGPILVVKAL